jgi:hypothetical protein
VVVNGTEVGPNLNRVGLAILGVRLEAADALQVHARSIGARIGRSVFGWAFAHSSILCVNWNQRRLGAGVISRCSSPPMRNGSPAGRGDYAEYDSDPN